MLDVYQHHMLSQTRGLMSKLYFLLLNSVDSPFTVQRALCKDLNLTDDSIDWTVIWDTFKFIHRAYLTPRKHNLMKIIPLPIHDLCCSGQIASFRQIYWDWSGVARFWSMGSSSLSDLLNALIPCCPGLLHLNDDSLLALIMFPSKLRI